jgi:zona occludens toxin
MIRGVTGTPGSGKSFYCVRVIANALASGKMVATNVTLADGWEHDLAKRNPISHLIPGRVAKRTEHFKRQTLYTDDLHDLIRVRLRGSGEGRGVAVIDEAHEWLNNRTWDDEERKDFVRWFSQHRKLGWDVYLISQHIDSIDKQVRDRVEELVVLRNLRRAKIAGIPLAPVNLFLAITVWAGGPKGRGKVHVSRRELFPLDSRRKLYDTFGLQNLTGDTLDNAIWLPRRDNDDDQGEPSASADAAPSVA